MQNENPSIVGANNNLFFTIGSLISFIILISVGVIKEYHIIYGFLMLPPLFFASYTSKYLLAYASNIEAIYFINMLYFFATTSYKRSRFNLDYFSNLIVEIILFVFLSIL